MHILATLDWKHQICTELQPQQQQGYIKFCLGTSFLTCFHRSLVIWMHKWRILATELAFWFLGGHSERCACEEGDYSFISKTVQGTRNTRIHGGMTRPDTKTVTKGKYMLRNSKHLLRAGCIHLWNGPIRNWREPMTWNRSWRDKTVTSALEGTRRFCPSSSIWQDSRAAGAMPVSAW